MTFYSKDNVTHFENIVVDGKVFVVPLLEASRGIVRMIDLFGTAFKPVKSDVNGNIDKLTKKYEMDPENFKTLDAMLDDELANKKTTLASDGGLWLMRALKFLKGIMSGLLEDFKAGVKTDSMKPILLKSYEDALKRYHGFIAQKLFSGVSSFAPYRKDLEKKLCLDKEDILDQLYAEMEVYLTTLSPVLETMAQLYVDKNLDSDKKA